MNLEEYKKELKQSLDAKENEIKVNYNQYKKLEELLRNKARLDKDLSDLDFVMFIRECNNHGMGLWQCAHLNKVINKVKKFDYYEKTLNDLFSTKQQGWITQNDYDMFFAEYIGDARKNKNISLDELMQLVEKYEGDSYEL